MTERFYASVLQRLPNGTRLLDVGVGTGTALARNASLIREKGLNLVGIDIDADYLERCAVVLREAGLDGCVSTYRVGVDDYQGGPFEAAYFSDSLMLMPDPGKALRHVSQLLQPGGRIYCTQTFEKVRNPCLEFFKPLLKFATSIDFGQVTYAETFQAFVDQAGLRVEEDILLEDFESREFRLLILSDAKVKKA